MTRHLIINIFRFFLLIFVQILVLNNIQLGSYINPFLYVLFIILLPFETPKWILIILGFSIGLIVDIFSGTPGMHAAATTFVAFARPFILQVITNRDGYEIGTKPTISYYGIMWFIKYTFLLIFLHHFVLFFLEIFRFTNFFQTFTKVVFSSMFTFVLVMMSQLFTSNK